MRTKQNQNKTCNNKNNNNEINKCNKTPGNTLLTLTYCGVSHEGLPVGHHGVHSHLLEVLAGDDRDGRLLGCLHLRHLLDHRDQLLVRLYPGEAVQVVLQSFDLLVQLELRDEDPDLSLIAAGEGGAEGLQGDRVGVGLLYLLQDTNLARLGLSLYLWAD